MMDDFAPYHGGLVALEGSADVVGTQLRLLPTSPQISILPPVQSYLKDVDTSERFDARSFIRRMHHAMAARNDVAFSFLRDSTPDNKRLVFMNGSTPGVQAICIKAIAEHETDGNIAQAELLFNNIVKYGLAGLDNDYTSNRGEERHNRQEEDPITRAMRAADSLDRLTADLQPDTDLDFTLKTRPRSMSLPMYSFDDRFGDAAPFYVFGVRSEEENGYHDNLSASPFLPATPRLALTDFNHNLTDAMATFFDTNDSFAKPLRSPSCVGEAYDNEPVSPRPTYMADMLSPLSPNSTQSTGPVVYGEAAVVHMHAVTRRQRPMKRTKSLDRTYPSSNRRGDTIVRVQSQTRTHGEEELPANGRRYSCMETLPKTSLPTVTQPENPRTVYVRCERPTILLSSPPSKSSKTAKSFYVDKGTDAEEIPFPEPPFRFVLPLNEDLIIKFDDGAPDVPLETIIRAFKAGTYPTKLPVPSGQPRAGETSVPGTPKLHTIETVSRDSASVVTVVTSFGPDPDEYDPFAYGPIPLKPAISARRAPKLNPSALPTPTQTPPPPSSICKPVGEKFHNCDISSCKTAVAVQNTLRVILNVHFPPEDQGYHHFHFSILPEMGGLWKPVFREADPQSPRSDRRRIDQILAVGSQRGVKKTYLSSLIAQLEKLGAKTGDISRSGRLDFRYLVANAMQAFTAQPLANQTHDNPFTNPYLLATLIIPHLEPYFVIHNEVRFLLLEYPPDHLATVLALQKLVGVDLMKVAAIVDSNAKEALPFNHIRGASITQVKEGSRSGSVSPQGKSPHSKSSSTALSEGVAVSKANFLLTSTATEAEITDFVSTIRKLLIEVSRFYVPEEPLRPRVGKRIPTPISGSFSPFPKTSMGLQSPPLSPPPMTLPPTPMRYHPRRPPSPAMSSKAPSLTETVKTIRSTRSRRSKSRKSGGTFGPAADRLADAVSLLTVNFEDDSDYDQEERRLMPIFMPKPHTRKGNNRKALKFLGLA